MDTQLSATAPGTEPPPPLVPGQAGPGGSDQAASRGLTARRVRVTLALLLVLAGVLIASMLIGSRFLSPGTVLNVLVGNGSAEDQAIVIGLRLPRTLIGLAAGAALGIAGALMQGLTRNPLADPFILGVSAGAASAVVIATTLLGVTAAAGYVWFGFFGAAAATAVVYAVASTGGGGATPTKLALSGAAVSALLGSLTTAVLLLDPLSLDQYRFWMVGSLTAGTLTQLAQLIPFFLVGFGFAIVAATQLDTLALGDDLARALGTRVGAARLCGAVAITLLAGSSVAIAGPIAFVGLVVPHLARLLAGPNQRWIVALSAILAPCLLIAADIVGRLVLRPAEVQAGVIAALLGAPVFIFLVRRYRLAGL